MKIGDLGIKGFVIASYPLQLRKAVEKAVASWGRFYALPTEIKKSLPYSNSADGVGYELKDGSGPKGDRKENFDVALGGAGWLRQNVEKIKNPVALDFLQDATALVGIMKPLVLDFARQAEQAFSLPDFADEVDQSADAYFVRFIHYFGDKVPGEETASAHADQSGFTLHLFESAPGLQCLTFDRKWEDMPVSVGQTVIIGSMQMQLRSDNRVKALCHRVVANSLTAKAGRSSAVCFVQLKKTPKYDKENQGRLQEKEPGFNYNLSADDFRKLFR